MIPLPLRGQDLSLLLAGLLALLCGGLTLLPGEPGQVAARVGLVGLALAVALALRRRRAIPSAPPRLRVVDRAALARDTSVVLVELDGRPVLLGVGRDGVRLLAETGWMGPEVEP